MIKKTDGINFVNTNNVKKDSITKTDKGPEEIKDGKKKLALALGALAVTGAVAAGIVYKVKKGQGVTLKDIQFNKGIATLKKGGQKYTGEIKHTLKNGDKVILNYADGIIQSSQRSGSVNFNKVFNYDSLGSKNLSSIITTFANGTTREFQRTTNGHVITENGVAVKEFFNKSRRMVVNDFSKDQGILEHTTILDKASNEVQRIKQTAAEKAAEIRGQNFNNIDKSTIIKDLGEEVTIDAQDAKQLTVRGYKFKDGTSRYYDKDGNLRHILNNDGSLETYYTNGVLQISGQDRILSLRPNGTVQMNGEVIYGEDGVSNLLKDALDAYNDLNK